MEGFRGELNNIAERCRHDQRLRQARTRAAAAACGDVHAAGAPSVTKTFPSTTTPSLDRNSAAAAALPSTRLCTCELFAKTRLEFKLPGGAAVHWVEGCPWSKTWGR